MNEALSQMRKFGNYAIQKASNCFRKFKFHTTRFYSHWVSLIRSLLRALDAVGSQIPTSDPVMLWQVVLQTFGTSVYLLYIHKLLLIQWMIWLMECQLDTILALLIQNNNKKELLATVNLQTVIRNLALTMEEDSSLMTAMAAKDLKDLLLICTVIAQGVEQINKEKYSEALEAFQEVKGCPSPRRLLAQIHTLTGQSFGKLVQPHCALHCYRKALEVDFTCNSALYQSVLVFRQLGNPKVEIEALHLLYSKVQLKSDKSSSSASLVSPARLCWASCAQIGDKVRPTHSHKA
ncbi:Fanconi anemia group G protein-like [Myxocyprinus asiaticus]|uniref:Fanconi anemia group G protein-like n=1 Tax=Myxocyprinus asiaticus TaxID=70543 RepID=UPI002223126E|nr:Fanconi anemia group G protein-like [Myxocyprinus asiaticus]